MLQTGTRLSYSINIMLIQLILGCIIIACTVCIHAVALSYTFDVIEKLSPKLYRLLPSLWVPSMMATCVLMVFLAHIIEIWVWALFYLGVDAMPTLEAALYFATSSFTTVGFGDVVLSEKWRLISSFQSANGFILFGWSTAFIFEVMSKLYKDEKIRKTKT